MSEKLYTFTVPTVIRATREVYVIAASQEEATELLREGHWYDSETSELDEECEWNLATLDEVQEWDDE